MSDNGLAVPGMTEPPPRQVRRQSRATPFCSGMIDKARYHDSHKRTAINRKGLLSACRSTSVGGIVQIVPDFLLGSFTRLSRPALAVGVTVVSSIFLFVPAASAAGGGSSDTASLSVAGPSPFPAQLSSPSKTGSRTATIHPVILNTGTSPASVTFSASLDVSDGNCANPTITVTSDQPSPITLAAGASVAPMLTVTMNQYCPGIDGTIIVMGGTGASPASLRFALTNSVQESEYWYPVAGGLGAGVLFLAVML